MRRRLLIAGFILAACAFAGGAYAASSDNPSPRQAFLNDVAQRLHVSPQQLRSAFKGAAQDQLKALVKAGRLTQAQANAIEKRLRQGGPPPVPFFGGRLSPRGLRWRGPLRPAPGFSPRAPLFGLGPLATATHYLGMTPVQLFDQLRAGKSVAQIARARGKSVSGLESAVVSAERSRLDRARQGGLISRSEEQKLLSRIQATVAALVNQKGSLPRFGPAGAPRLGPLRFQPRNEPRFRPKMVPPLGAPQSGPPPLG
jgi:AraC-like DNA-binding protein